MDGSPDMSADRGSPEAGRLRRLVRQRQRLQLLLALILICGYLGLILAMAFAPSLLAVTTRPGGNITGGLYWSFLYSLVTLLIMGIYVWWRTSAPVNRESLRH